MDEDKLKQIAQLMNELGIQMVEIQDNSISWMGYIDEDDESYETGYVNL